MAADTPYYPCTLEEPDFAIPMVGEVRLSYKTVHDRSEREKCLNPKDVERIVRELPEMKENIDYKELIYAIYLNSAKTVLAVMKVCEGGLDCAPADIRMIMQGALLCNATAMVLVHNHPSGLCKPSKADDTLTRTLKEAGRLMNIGLKDHIVISSEDSYSYYAEARLL